MATLLLQDGLRLFYFFRLRIDCGLVGGIKLVNGSSVATRDKVPVNVDGHFNAGMPELLLHINRALSFAQQEAGISMPDIM